MSNPADGDDQSTPGPGVSDGVQEQLTRGDTLSNSPFDPLDEGYSPPDREPRTQVPTEAEEQEGLSLDQLLDAEEPDVSADNDRVPNLFDEEGVEVGGKRSGRLAGSDLGDWSANSQRDGELWGDDVGIDGAGASAEEAAVHVIDDDEDLED